MKGNKTTIDTLVVHAGREVDPSTGAVAPPLHLSTTFARGVDGELLGEHLYGRHGNPTRDRLETALAALEGAAAAAAFASGCAVAEALFTALRSGDRVIVSDDMYFGIRQLLRELGESFGVEVTALDLDDDAAVDRALAARPKLLLCESPTNPLLRVVDIAALAGRCHAQGTTLVVDNTLASPILQQPLTLGADFVMCSTTKFLSGHGDVLGGALLAADEAHPLWRRLAKLRKVTGASPSPFDCWLLLRSIATLSLRVHRQVDNAEALAAWLADQPGVEAVLYPGLASHPQHAIARRQMKRPGSMLSLLLAGGEAGARRFMARLELFTRATSLGSVHSLAEHRRAVEGPDSTTPDNLVRLSIGIEDLEDLRTDLARALEA
ncbi:MAG: PLP-dependent aspartate aminotransferase family protein [Polyangiaceae bacterium]